MYHTAARKLNARDSMSHTRGSRGLRHILESTISDKEQPHHEGSVRHEGKQRTLPAINEVYCAPEIAGGRIMELTVGAAGVDTMGMTFT